MKITKTKETGARSSRIILARDGRDTNKYISRKDQANHIIEQIENKKDTVVLNQLDHLVIFRKLDDADPSGFLRLENARKAGHGVHAILNEHEIKSVVVINGGVEAEECAAFIEGVALTNYQFLKYYTREPGKEFKLKEILVSDELLNDDRVEKLQNLIMAVYQTRDLINEPLSFLTAKQLSSEIERMGIESGFTVEVFNKKKIESLKMGGLLAVNRGSLDPPTFSILSWNPDDAVNNHPIVLVGKGIVFDTGGLSLKPTHDSMDYMKSDMSGAAAVAGTLYAVAKNRIPVRIVGLIPATDNRPDGNAYVPGDVVTMHNGTTVEVLNTDAEGRMLLADALSYAKKYDPELVIEISTLTGSAQAAIGKYGIVGMGNAGRELMESLKESGDYTAERIAEFPFWDDYKEELKSDLADLKNIGSKYAGAITAGKFLEHFTDYPYIHLDIAGPSFNKAPYNYRGKGGSGVGVRLLYNFFLNRSV